MRWSEFAARQPGFAAVAHHQLIGPGVVLAGTLFAVDINDVAYIGHDAETNAQHVARWPADEEYLRPSLAPTSLGPPQPVRQLLTATQPGPSSP